MYIIWCNPLQVYNTSGHCTTGATCTTVEKLLPKIGRQKRASDEMCTCKQTLYDLLGMKWYWWKMLKIGKFRKAVAMGLLCGRIVKKNAEASACFFAAIQIRVTKLQQILKRHIIFHTEIKANSQNIQDIINKFLSRQIKHKIKGN